MSQVSRRSEVKNHKRRSLNTRLFSGTSAGTFACPAEPYRKCWGEVALCAWGTNWSVEEERTRWPSEWSSEWSAGPNCTQLILVLVGPLSGPLAGPFPKMFVGFDIVWDSPTFENPKFVVDENASRAPGPVIVAGEPDSVLAVAHSASCL